MVRIQYYRMPPKFADNRITYLANTNHRNRFTRFGIKRTDRLSHAYIIGKTGSGKSNLLESIVRQDIENGEGCALIDPHGDLVERIAAHVPKHRRDDLIYLDAPDRNQPYGYNPLRYVVEDRRSLAASGIMEVFKKLWHDAWGVRMEHILRNSLLALLDRPGSTLADLPRLLIDDTFRKGVVGKVQNAVVREFWQNEFEEYSKRYRADSIAPVLNKVGAFLSDPTLHRILTKPERPLSLRTIMDEGKILLVNLSKGRLGEDSASLLGALLMTSIGLAAFSRADIPEDQRRPFFVCADEFQTFTTLAVAGMASELRKYGVGVTLVHQFLQQVSLELREAILGNAGTLISFRLGARDAPYFAKEFQPAFNELDLITLPNHDIYLKLMIDGAPSRPFSATTVLSQDILV